jgi:hypothetical protein
MTTTKNVFFVVVSNNNNDDEQMEWYDCVCTDKETHNGSTVLSVLLVWVLWYLLPCDLKQQQQQRRR